MKHRFFIRQIWVSVKNSTEMREAMAAETDRVLYREEGAVTVADLAQEYLGSVKETMKPATYALYENYALNEVVPRIGSLEAVRFDQKALETFLAKCLYSRDGKTRRAQNTMYAIEEVLRAIFRHGAQIGRIPEMALGKKKYQRSKQGHDVAVLSKWEVQGILHEAHTAGLEQELQVMLPLYLGLNLSELCGLKWEDIDFAAGKVYIHRCIKRIMQTKPDGSTSTEIISYELDERERRIFRLPEPVCHCLEQAFYGNLESESSQVPLQEESWYVSSLNYKYAEGRTLQYRLKKLGDKVGIENLSYRYLRDTFAVNCLQSGANVMTLAKILGINMQVVCDRYGEWMRYDDSFLRKLGEAGEC